MKTDKKATPAPEPEETWNTTDMNKIRVKAGTIDEGENALVFRPIEIVDMEGKNGAFIVVKGVDADNPDIPMELITSSQKLTAIFKNYWDRINQKKVKVTATGVGFNREYKVMLVK